MAAYDPTKPDSTSAAKDTPTYIKEAVSVSKTRYETNAAALAALTNADVQVGQLGWAADTMILYRCSAVAAGSSTWVAISLSGGDLDEAVAAGAAPHAWTDRTVTTFPAWAKKAILACDILRGTANYAFLSVRKNGTTPTRYPILGAYTSTAVMSGMLIVSLDANGKFESQLTDSDGTASCNINAVGYL